MKLGNKIGEGRFRECFELGTDPEYCVKVHKDRVRTEFVGGLTFETRGSLLRALRFGTTDINRREFKVIEGLPDFLRGYTPDGICRVNGSREGSKLIMQRPKDFNGAFSKTLKEHGPEKNEDFWTHVDAIAEFMVRSGLINIDAFSRGNNVMVQKITEESSRPVLIDMKFIGAIQLMRRPELHFTKKGLAEELYRRINRLKDRFGP